MLRACVLKAYEKRWNDLHSKWIVETILPAKNHNIALFSKWFCLAATATGLCAYSTSTTYFVFAPLQECVCFDRAKSQCKMNRAKFFPVFFIYGIYFCFNVWKFRLAGCYFCLLKARVHHAKCKGHAFGWCTFFLVLLLAFSFRFLCSTSGGHTHTYTNKYICIGKNHKRFNLHSCRSVYIRYVIASLI